MELKKHINIRISEHQFNQLMKTVEEQESNLSDLVRKLIDNYESRKANQEKGKTEQ